ncbi:hypothetical protein DPMN_049849 [Dreissena polymorpha]|uniref:Uncharacterized protein n=1 Tax=Dreissena polymorpha TaxID=45954 RepID=A0A9D4HKT3_DREPO|nr:hypothetical protein DPMN_049849 [Dreissena polymorpha]
MGFMCDCPFKSQAFSSGCPQTADCTRKKSIDTYVLDTAVQQDHTMIRLYATVTAFNSTNAIDTL